jgi:hypothetical protein
MFTFNTEQSEIRFPQGYVVKKKAKTLDRWGKYKKDIKTLNSSRGPIQMSYVIL